MRCLTRDFVLCEWSTPPPLKGPVVPARVFPFISRTCNRSVTRQSCLSPASIFIPKLLAPAGMTPPKPDRDVRSVAGCSDRLLSAKNAPALQRPIDEDRSCDQDNHCPQKSGFVVDQRQPGDVHAEDSGYQTRGQEDRCHGRKHVEIPVGLFGRLKRDFFLKQTRPIA